jgi:hypothetical protein
MAETNAPAAVEGEDDFAKDGPGIYARWDAELRLAKTEVEDYRERCAKIVRRYRSESEIEGSTGTEEPNGLQLLWSTVQTQIPAIYQFPPAPEVSRRFKAKAPAARVASTILERYLQVEIDRDRFSDETLAVLLDRCLCAMGQMWVEYEPIVGKVPQPVAVVPQPDGSMLTAGGLPYDGPPPQPTPDGQMMGEQEFDAIVDCRAPAVHIDLTDFLHSPARKWREVRWVARRHYYTRDECVEQFGDGMEKYGWDPQRIPLTAKAHGTSDEDKAPGDIFKRAEVWQIWDDKAIYYIASGMGVPLDVRERPLALSTTRWPCPRPLYGTMTSGTMIPVPDFIQWQGLSAEVDELTERIEALTRAVKIVGARAADAPELERVLTEENVLVPVDNWAAFAERGGLAGMISFLPVRDVMEVLTKLQEQRRERVDYIYQINGIGDILRGQGDPRATATQERIKASFGSLRLRQMQHDLGEFIERVLEIKAEIICEKAPPEVLVEVSAIRENAADAPWIDAAVQMLKDSRVRDLRIDIDERSMVALHDDEEKQSRMEFLQAFAPLIDKATAAAQQSPELGDVIGETMLFGVRGFRVGRDMEGTFEAYLEGVRDRATQAREQAKNQPPPPPLPLLVEQTRAQNAANLERERHNNKMAEIQTAAQNETVKERAQAISEAAIEQFRGQSKEAVARTEAALETRLIEMQHQFDMALEAFKAKIKADADQQASQMERLMRQRRRRRLVLDENGDPLEAIEEIMSDDDDDGGASVMVQ